MSRRRDFRSMFRVAAWGAMILVAGVLILPPGSRDAHAAASSPAPEMFQAVPAALAAGAADDQGKIPNLKTLPLPEKAIDGVAPLQASPGVTAISGRVVTTDGSPLTGVSVRSGDIATITDTEGRYLLAGTRPGPSVMTIDARRAGAGYDTDYGYYDIKVESLEGVTTILPYKHWLPKIDYAHEVTIASPTTADTVITNPLLPGIELHIPAGTVLTDADHKPVTKLSLTPIPSDRTPYPLPNNVTVPQYFTIQPGDATATGVGGKWVGVQIWYPNYRNELPGARQAFWRYDPYGPGWVVYGVGTASADGRHMVPDEHTRLYDLTGAMFSGPTPPANGPPPYPALPLAAGPPVQQPDPGDKPPCESCGCDDGCGEPVDPATGLWNYGSTDLKIADVMPVAIVRSYRQGDPNTRSFGVGMTLNYESYFFSANPYQEADLITPQGGRIHFVRTSPGTGYVDAVFTSTTAPGPYYNSILSWNGNGWDLRLQDGSLYVYGENAPLQYFQDRFGNRTSLTRATPSGPIQAISSPNGRWVKFTYTGPVIATATDNAGRAVSYGYDANNRLTTVTDPNGGITTYVWDTVNNRITNVRLPRQQPSGAFAVSNVYDSNNRLQQQTLADGTVFTFAYTLDAGGKVTAADLTMKDTPHPGGILRKLTFNSDGYWLTDKRAYGTPEEQDSTATRGGTPPPTSCTLNTPANSPTNALIALVDGLNRRTCFTYSSGGRPLTIKKLAGLTTSVTYTYTYGAYNQLASIKDPLNHTTTIGLDSLGRPISVKDALNHSWTISPNPDGQIGSITDPLGHATSYGYDHGDLVTLTDALGRVSKFYADALGRRVQSADPKANTWKWAFDPIWGVRIATDANGNAVTTNYNLDGLVASVVDPRSVSYKTQYVYDVKDRLITRTDPLSHNDTINSYDGFDNPLITTDRKSQNAIYTYDALGRIATAAFADGHNAVYTWDKASRLTEAGDTIAGVTNKVIRVYDGLDRLTSETVIQGTTTIGTVAYTYDKASRRATMDVPGQAQVIYTFDNADRLTTITQGSSVVSLGYDNANRRTSLSFPNGIVGTYAYDDADELTSISYANAAGAIGHVSYVYDESSRISSRGGSLFKSILPETLVSATYNANNQLTSWNGVAPTYDLNGNLINDDVRDYSWDARNRLITIRNGLNIDATFTYDGLNRRNSATRAGVGIATVYDGYEPVQEQSLGGSIVADFLTGVGTDDRTTRTRNAGGRLIYGVNDIPQGRWVVDVLSKNILSKMWGVDERFVRIESGQSLFYLTDLLNSSIGLSDYSGAIQTQYGYEPFGGTVQTGAASANKFQFTGRENDGFSLYYYRARYYSPVWGRFVSEDPIGYGGGVNLYSYASQNPIIMVDPDGLATYNRFGLPKRFWRWYHRNYKRPGDADIGYDEACELYDDWCRARCPKGPL